jgi:hypothetical protein
VVAFLEARCLLPGGAPIPSFIENQYQMVTMEDDRQDSSWSVKRGRALSTELYQFRVAWELLRLPGDTSVFGGI